MQPRLAVSPTVATAVLAAVTEPLYYLHNFHTVLAWVGARYGMQHDIPVAVCYVEWAEPFS